MARLIWSPRARDDLRAIRRHIAQDSRQVAERFTQRVLDVVGRLESFPLSGRLVPEDEHGHLREVLVQDYRVIYQVFDGDVEILIIQHGARRLTDIPECCGLTG